MARTSRVDVINTLIATGLVPVFYTDSVEKGKRIIDACARGGARTIEFTNRGDLAYRVFGELIDYAAGNRPEAILGVGSVLDEATAALYLNSGANFVVGPVLNERVARTCNRRKVAYSPGCGTVSEISRAEEMGVEIVKIFPGGQVGGPAFVKAVLGPMPWTRIMPTGGVEPTRESIEAWIKAGATCLGIGSKLVAKDLVAREDWAALTEKVAQCLKWIKEARG
jgi:2-dehydro-3-deoxyphosphogluconate aldolase/(4S)-4-hydroxy-2-oxoglutarate aldolase